MAKFSFRLQSFLNLKEKLEDQKKLDYGRALSQLEQEKQKKIQMETEKDENILFFRENIQQKINPSTIQGYNDYIELMKKKIVAQQKVIIKAENMAEKKRIALIEAMKERKTLDALKDKAHIEYVQSEKIAEQKIVDEIVSYQYNNR